jgi:hypothetical protein
MRSAPEQNRWIVRPADTRLPATIPRPMPRIDPLARLRSAMPV